MSLYDDHRSNAQIERDEFLAKARRCREHAENGTIPHLGEGPNGVSRRECWLAEAEAAERIANSLDH